MPIDDLLRRSLTPVQYAAATDPSATILTLACAGSGKTRTTAFRIARLVADGEPPNSIVAFTFTDKAAESMKLQVARALGAAGFDPSVIGAMYIGTIHGYCQELLGQIDARYRQFDVLDDNRLKLYLISRYRALELDALQQAQGAKYFATIKEAADAYKILNDEVIRIEDVAAADPLVGRVLGNIRDRLNTDQFIDFSLMIRLVVDALERGDAPVERAVGDLRHLIVDEYQDVNPSQERLVQQLRRRAQTLFVVGDDDQAIYAWRGADVNNILTFAQRNPGCASHTLPKNFRSTPAIVATADQFAAAELGAARIVKNPDADIVAGPRDLRKVWFDTWCRYIRSSPSSRCEGRI
jgi:DNA helicase-2/ATP-dependent DNA helicase PcrA